eukprot:TRINITY_DN32300_c0_g1_i1.p1 TRINITY_DN32300_c0_g1~~TRINITY_DN32300_c0_g1_i1.p1  ORF type:complete len:173 (-),score=37.09 TRINITY_DN32300_c0_g1_i1:218-736(-)
MAEQIENAKEDQPLSDFVKLLRLQGNAEVKSGRFRQAIEHYSKALERCIVHPNESLADEDAHRTEAEAASMMSDEASEAGVLPNDVAALLGNRCLCYMKLGRYKDASEDAKVAVMFDPTYAKGFYRLSLCQKELSDLAGAWESVTRAVALEPENEEIRALETLIERLEHGEI